MSIPLLLSSSPQDLSKRHLAHALPGQFAETTVGELCQALGVGKTLLAAVPTTASLTACHS